MKKRLLAALATGLFLVGMSASAQALILTTVDYNALFDGAPPLPTDYSVQAVTGGATQESVYDMYGELIGYINPTLFTGIYIGTVTQTPPPGGGNQIVESEMVDLIKYFLGDSDYSAEIFLKADVSSSGGTDTEGLVTLNVTSILDLKSGNWEITDSDPLKDYALSFYGVKSSTEWAMYYVDPALSSGKWSTVHLLNQNDKPRKISHFGGVAESSPVPEPATMLLFGTGLAGLAAVARRRKN